MKWTIEKVCIPLEYVIRDTYRKRWVVPFVRFFSYGEPTPYFLALVFPSEDRSVEPVEIALYEVDLNGNQHLEAPPFVRRTIRRQLDVYSEALASACWYLEKWDKPACSAYRRCRGAGGDWCSTI